MGRKAVAKVRIDNPAKKEQFSRDLIPFFQEKGLRNITMDHIASHLGKTKATLYKYFQSRDEIIAHGLQLKLAEIQEFENLLFDESQPYLERYRSAVSYFSEHISEISNLFLSDLKKIFPDIWLMIENFKNYCLNLVKQYYTKGIELGCFQNIHPVILVTSDEFFINLLSDPEFLEDNSLTIQQAFDEYFNMKFNGIMR